MAFPSLPFGATRQRSKLVDSGLPRRLTVRRADPDYDPRAKSLSERIDVLLDGNVLPEVASYDVDLGRIDRQARDAAGRLILEGPLPAYETLYGHVEVRWIRGAEGARS